MAKNRDKLLEMLSDGTLDSHHIAKAVLCWLSEDDCTAFAESEGIELEEEIEETPSYDFDDEVEVNEAFAERWAERIRAVPAYANDKPAKRQDFTFFVDELHREGRISEELADSVTLANDD